MSVVPANIVVDFYANMVGSHRVCYRQGNSGEYTCLLTTCLSIGACSISIPVFVDNETCTEVLYTGYVQAACREESSNQDRELWDYTFSPIPACKSYVVKCYRLSIASVTITDGGSGYNPLPAAPPDVHFTGNGGATGVAVIGTGVIDIASLFNPGSGYNDGTYTNVAVTGGTGTGAKATVVVSGGVVTSVVITNGGTGYTTATTLGLDATDLGGSTPGVLARFISTTDYGKIISVSTIVTTAPYTAVPAVTFTGGAGTGGAGTVVLDDCPAITTSGCSGDPVVIPAGAIAQITDTMTICGYTAPALDTAYAVSEDGNCRCSGVTATIGVSGAVGTQVRYFYNKNALEVRTGLLTVGGSPSSVVDCIVPGSLVFQILTVGTTGTVTYGVSCGG